MRGREPGAQEGPRGFSRLLGAHFVSNVGDSLNFIGRSLLAIAISDSSVFLAVLFVAASLPEGIASLFSGRICDRYANRLATVLAWSYALQAPFAVALGLVALRGEESEAAFLLAIACLAALRGVGNPPENALVPQLLADEKLMSGVGAVATAYRVAQIVGPAIAGILLLGVGLPALFFLDGLSYVVAGVLVVGLDRAQPPRTAAPAAKGFGLGYLRGAGRQAALVLALQVWIYLLCMPLYVTFLSLVDRGELRFFEGARWLHALAERLPVRTGDLSGQDVVLLGCLLVSFAAGFTLVATTVMRRSRGPSLTLLSLVTLASAALLAAAALVASPAVSGLCLFLFAGASAVCFISLDTLLQRSAAPEQRVRVFGLRSAALVSLAPLSFLLVGAGIEASDARTVLLLQGVLLGLCGLAMPWTLRGVHWSLSPRPPAVAGHPGSEAEAL